MSQELVFQVVLELIPGLGGRGIKQLISYCGSASSVFSTPKQKLLKIPGVGERLVAAIRNPPSIREAERIISNAEDIGACILHYTHPDFPKRLSQIPDSPTLIFSKGSGDLNPRRSIAVVGTRKATDYGKRIVDQLISDLSRTHVNVVSGLAYGIDIHAHRACLKHGIPTHAVIAGGLDRIYPSEHKKYLKDIMENGCIISESPPGTKPDPHLFPTRNRIIAGMTDATVVVEAAEKGGALITAQLANSYDREVFAVPGDLGRNYSLGTNSLIAKQQAQAYTSINDLIYHLNWDLEDSPAAKAESPDLPEEEALVFDLLLEKQKAIEIDLISIQTQLPVNRVASILLSLEFQNLVKSLPGKKFQCILSHR